MKLLLVHNRYLLSGGEDLVFAEESALLRRAGHDVVEYTEDNRRIEGMGRAAAAVRAVWSSGTRVRLLEFLRRHRPEVAHLHNTFPLVSPSAYWACRETGTPVVQTLHNYRLLCASALLYHDGHTCEDCLGTRLLWPGLLHGCYRSSRAETAAVTSMLLFHRLLGTWRKAVDLYVALSDFSRTRFIQGGIPADRIAVKPNFVHPDPGARDGDGDYALFVGRLSQEKGIRVLLDAWSETSGVPLVIVGDGPMRDRVEGFACQGDGAVRYRGALPRPRVFEAMKRARFLVFPSTCYENFPMAIIEAFACGLPVLAAGIGAAPEIVEHGRTGALFRAGDPASLAQAARELWAKPGQARAMGGEARAEYLAKYTARENYARLMDLYARAREGGASARGGGLSRRGGRASAPGGVPSAR